MCDFKLNLKILWASKHFFFVPGCTLWNCKIIICMFSNWILSQHICPERTFFIVKPKNPEQACMSLKMYQLNNWFIIRVMTVLCHTDMTRQKCIILWRQVFPVQSWIIAKRWIISTVNDQCRLWSWITL